ncbi:MAG: hypothetical protein FJ100_20080 [Deltaproteobacteria bacterium]|nr:hypothetical protein [Deltaproteobacteria bacterium]
MDSSAACLRCGLRFAPEARRAGGISVLVTGDEVIYSYWRCGACGWYSIEEYYDAFLGDSTVRWGPVVRPEIGDRALRWIAQCPDPHDKWCECDAHRALATGVPPWPDETN